MFQIPDKSRSREVSKAVVRMFLTAAPSRRKSRRKQREEGTAKHSMRPWSSGSVWYRAFVRRFVCLEKVLVNASKRAPRMPLHRPTHNALCLSAGLSGDRSAQARLRLA